MQVKQRGVSIRSQSAGSTQAPARPAAEKKAGRAQAPDVKHSVAQGTAGEFARAATGKKAGKSALNVRVESQQDMNMAAGRSLEKSEKAMRKLEAQFSKGMSKEDKADFRAEQAAFQGYLEARATFAGNLEARGGSLMPLIYADEAKVVVDHRAAMMGDRVKNGAANYSSTSDVTDAPQQEMNRAAYATYEKADKAMNAMAGKVAGHLEGDDLKEFKASEKAFDGYRQAVATLEGNMEARGGTLAPLIMAGVLEGMTREHTQELATLLDHVKELGQR